MNKDKSIIRCIIEEKSCPYIVSLPSTKRDWMDVNNGHAYRCIPLNVANGFGWEILNPISFTATWNGNLGHIDAIKFDFQIENDNDRLFVEGKNISSHFGNGIITFSYLGFLFKTSEGHNLFIKGPTNKFKHGAQALEAIVETDWLPYTFTLNWKLTKENEPVQFLKGEALATIFPIPRYYLESFDAVDEKEDPNSEFAKTRKKWGQIRSNLKLSAEKNKNHSFYSRGLQDIDQNKIYDNHQRSIKGCPFHKKD
jgi:hypothetical protein